MKLKITIDKIPPSPRINTRKLRQVVRQIFQDEGGIEGQIGVILVDDTYMRQLNKRFLNKKCSTDVLSFRMSEVGASFTEGEVYVNLDRTRQQAYEYGVTFENELYRLVAHGMLHLFNYKDDTPENKQMMTEKEDHYLSLVEA